jgi:hypothetical protein
MAEKNIRAVALEIKVGLNPMARHFLRNELD